MRVDLAAQVMFCRITVVPMMNVLSSQFYMLYVLFANICRSSAHLLQKHLLMRKILTHEKQNGLFEPLTSSLT